MNRTSRFTFALLLSFGAVACGETSGSVLTAMQGNDMFRRPDNYYDTLAGRYRSMNSGQLDSAARGALNPNNFVWVIVGDAKVVRPQLDSLGLPVEVIPASSLAPAKPK